MLITHRKQSLTHSILQHFAVPNCWQFGTYLAEKFPGVLEEQDRKRAEKDPNDPNIVSTLAPWFLTSLCVTEDKASSIVIPFVRFEVC